MYRRRPFIGGLAAALVPSAGRPDDFPARPITLIVPFAAGGAMDVVARLVTGHARDALGEAVVVDNRGGAAGLIAAATVARAAPDGYTLLLASAAQVTIPPWINRSLTFDPTKELVPVAHLVDTPMLLIVSAASSLRTVDDLVREARGHRGGVNYASTGVGTISHLVMESLRLAADIDVVHVPYRGAAPALNDLQAGRVQAMFTSTASAAPLLAADRVRALAVTSRNRSALLPTVPTLAEAGWPAAEVVVWAGVMAPSGLARPALRKLESAFANAVLAPDTGERLIKLGAEPVGHGATAFAEILQADLALWQRVALASGVKVE